MLGEAALKLGGLFVLALVALAFVLMISPTALEGLRAPDIDLPSFEVGSSTNIEEQAVKIEVASDAASMTIQEVVPDVQEQENIVQLEVASDSAVVAETEFIEVQWDTLPQTLQENAFFSMRHQESQTIASTLLALAGHSRKLPQKGDGRSNGSIRIFAGVSGNEGHIAILHVVSSNVSFAVLSAPVRFLNGACPKGSCIMLTKDAYIDPGDLIWTCAWMMSDQIGRTSQPMSTWLDVGQGWARWTEIQTRYSLVIQLLEVPLPPL